MSRTPKILYVEDELTKNIPRLSRLFGKFLGKADRKRLKEFEHDLYGANEEDIRQIFKTQGIDVEYRFSEVLSKVRKYADLYDLFIIDRNLAEVDYTMEELKEVDPQYTERLYERFREREGDYVLLKLAMTKKIDVLNKFYFLTAYSAQHEIRSSSALKDLIDFGAFQQNNFIEKDNPKHIDRLCGLIKNIPLDSPTLFTQQQPSEVSDLYVFGLRDGSTIKGTFVSHEVKIQTGNGKVPVETNQIIDVSRIEKTPNTEFVFELKSGDSLQGQIINKKLSVKTQIKPNEQIPIFTNNIQSIKVV